MLALARNPLHQTRGRAHPAPGPCRARVYTRPAVHAAPAPAAVPAPVATAPEEVGLVCKQMLGVLDADCNTVQDLVVPTSDTAELIRSTQEHLQPLMKAALNSHQVEVKLVGSAAAGTHLPGTSPAFFVQPPAGYVSQHQSHDETVKQLRRVIAQSAFYDMRNGRLPAWSQTPGLPPPMIRTPTVLAARTGPLARTAARNHSSSPSVGFDLLPDEPGIWLKPHHSTLTLRLLVGLHGASTAQQVVTGLYTAATWREVLSLATIVARTTLLQQQPPLFKLAARVAMHWAQSFMDAACFRDAPEFVELLVLKAFQQYQESASAGSTKSTLEHIPSTAAAAQQPSGPANADDSVDWVALDMILLNFLKLSASLQKKSLVHWDVTATLHVLTDPDQAAVLRPRGFEAHPLLLDPSNTHYNVATALTAQQLEVFVQHAQEMFFHAYHATIPVLLQRLQPQVPTSKLSQQPPDLLSKLDSQAHLLQQLITLLAEGSTQQPVVAAAGKDEQEAAGDTSLDEDPESSES